MRTIKEIDELIYHHMKWHLQWKHGSRWLGRLQLLPYVKREWIKWGLSSIYWYINALEGKPWDGCPEHDLVADYLNRHIRIGWKYLRDKRGFRYFDILIMAENEKKQGQSEESPCPG